MLVNTLENVRIGQDESEMQQHRCNTVRIQVFFYAIEPSIQLKKKKIFLQTILVANRSDCLFVCFQHDALIVSEVKTHFEVLMQSATV